MLPKKMQTHLITTYFGNIEPKKVEHKKFEEPIQTIAKTKTVYEDVPLNMVYIAFKMCDRLHPDYYVADITSDILANGTSSRLHQRLVKEAKAFVDMDAYITASNDIGMFVFEGKVSEGYDVYHAEQLVWKEIEQIKQDLVPEKELQKCKNKVLTYQNFSESSLLNRAISLAYYELLGNANLINEEEQHYEAIQTTDIQRFAKATFDKEKSNTLYYLKKDYLTK
jgi:zinc protease